jgi:phosphonate transport system substrate-binding protein
LANLTLAAHHYLVAHRLTPGTDVTLRPMGSHANSLAALEAGESAAAIISTTTLKQVGGQWENRIRILARLDRLPPLLYLANSRLGAATISRLQRRLLVFANEQPAGRQFAEALGHGGLRVIAEADMKQLDPYVNDLKKMHIRQP